jgi:3-oxoacyl-[acyl-carrier protein] reductase
VSETSLAWKALRGKSIIVTGGAHGIGRAYCEHLAQAGASVAVADIDGATAEAVAESIRQADGQACGVATDVASWQSVQTLVGIATERFGGVDGLVNNAALFASIPISRVGFEAITEDEWDRVMAVNVKGMWLCCRGVAPVMRQRGGGAIVNVSSNTVFTGSPLRLHYVASKAAIVGMTRVLSRELGADNIRVNAVAPGSTLSEEQPTEEIIRMREAPVARRSLQRVQTPRDVVGTVLFLISDDSAFITGQTLVVDGGEFVH